MSNWFPLWIFLKILSILLNKHNVDVQFSAVLCVCVSGRDLIKVLKWYVDRIIEADRQEHIQQVLKVRRFTLHVFSHSHKSFLHILPFSLTFRVCHYCPPSSDFLQPRIQIQFIFVMYWIFNFVGMVRCGPLWLPHLISSHSSCILN